MGIKDYLSHIIELKSGYGCGLRDINAVKKLQFEFEGGGNSDNRKIGHWWHIVKESREAWIR
jgi:hypothetical protein